MEWLVELCAGGHDLADPSVQWAAVAMSFAFFFCVYVVCVLVSWTSDTYNKLNDREKVFWHLSIVRAVFGFFAIYAGLYTVLFEPNLHANIVHGKSQTSYFAVMVTTGFFLFECITLFASNIYFRFIDWNLALHHLLSLIGFLLLVVYDSCHFFGNAGLLLEMTTPFSALCWLLIKAKKAHLTIWKINQLILIHLFHCRTTIELFIWWSSYKSLNLVLTEMPLPLMIITFVELSLINFYLTPFWTYKKTWQFFNPVDWNHPEAKKAL